MNIAVGYAIGQVVWARVKVKTIRIGKDGISYSVTSMKDECLNIMDLKDCDLQPYDEAMNGTRFAGAAQNCA